MYTVVRSAGGAYSVSTVCCGLCTVRSSHEVTWLLPRRQSRTRYYLQLMVTHFRSFAFQKPGERIIHSNIFLIEYWINDSDGLAARDRADKKKTVGIAPVGDQKRDISEKDTILELVHKVIEAWEMAQGNLKRIPTVAEAAVNEGFHKSLPQQHQDCTHACNPRHRPWYKPRLFFNSSQSSLPMSVCDNQTGTLETLLGMR